MTVFRGVIRHPVRARWLVWGSALIIVLLSVFAGPADARDVHLGGDSKKGSGIPPNVVELPTIVVAMRKDNGGWEHIKIDAWLMPKDMDTALLMVEKKSVIARAARDSLPSQSFEALSSPHSGTGIVKKLLHEIAEQSLGRPWTGEVLIRNMLVY